MVLGRLLLLPAARDKSPALSRNPRPASPYKHNVIPGFRVIGYPFRDELSLAMLMDPLLVVENLSVSDF